MTRTAENSEKQRAISLLFSAAGAAAVEDFLGGQVIARCKFLEEQRKTARAGISSLDAGRIEQFGAVPHIGEAELSTN